MKNNTFFKLAGFLFLLLTFTPLNAQGVKYNIPNIINIHKKDYKGENKNWSIAEDEKGCIYIGNDIGLLEFDGIEWNLESDHRGTAIKSVAVLSHNTIYTGGVDDFGRWDRDVSGKLKYTSLASDIPKENIKNSEFWKIWITDENVYFQSFKDIYIYNAKEVKRISVPKGFLFLLKVAQEYWVQEMGGGIFRLKGEKFEKIPGSEIFMDTDVRTITPFGKDKQLIGTSSRGLYIYDGTHFSKWDSPISKTLASKDLNCSLLSDHGVYFFGTILDGVYVTDLNGNIINHISTANKLQNNTILSMYQDDSKNIWLGLDRGLGYIQYVDNISCHIETSANTGSVYDAVVWENKLIIGTNQGIFYTSKDNLNVATPLHGLKLIEGSQGQTWSLKIMGGRLLACHNKGLMEIDKNMAISRPYNLKSGVYSVAEARIKDKDVLILPTYNILRVIDKTENKLYEIKELSEPTYKIEIDHLGNIWLEHTIGGVYRCSLNDDLKSINNSTYYPSCEQDSIPVRIRIFKFGGRIMLLSNNKIFTYDDISDKIIPNEELNKCFNSVKNIRKIVNIRHNLFWALTSNSIYKFSYDGYKAEILEKYNLSDNMSLVNGFENVSIINDSTNLICLDNGFLIYRGGNLNKKEQDILPTPLITSLGSKNTNGDQTYYDLSMYAEIPYKYNNISFMFLAKGTYVSGLKFQYKLTGVDTEWREVHNNNVSYERLPSGKYKFNVRTTDGLGQYSEASTYEFEVCSPWYLTFWMFGVYIASFMFVLYLSWILTFRRYRNIHLQKIRKREANRLKRINTQLVNQLEHKSAELLIQTSFIIKKNELIVKIKDVVEEFYSKSKSQTVVLLYHKINMLLNNNLNTDEDWKIFMITFEQKHAGFFKRMKDVYPELTNNDLRLCACLKLNLETKDIASLMNLSVRSVENNRYRLRKKLNLQATQSLSDFFLSFE